MVSAVFDTCVLIDCLNGMPEARSAIAAERRPAISAITWMEVMVGAPPGLRSPTSVGERPGCRRHGRGWGRSMAGTRCGERIRMQDGPTGLTPWRGVALNRAYPTSISIADIIFRKITSAR